MSESQTKAFKYLKNLMLFVIILLFVIAISSIGFGIYDRKESKDSIDYKQEYLRLKQIVKEQDDYINWQDCMTKDTVSCQICDSLYNPSGEFIY